ncbi:MAG: histidinol-phosphatase HisJ family protein [Abditibacteriota bacterium]|nr:histidinol-phosphatase HisJ family protein [Abditibacteriota bacterium]
MFGFHNHTYYCEHAVNTPAEIIEEAIKRGFSSIGISEHFGKLETGEFITPGHSMTDPVAYFKECARAKDIYQDKIDILIGVEMDYGPYNPSLLYKEILEFNPDYILGSVHLCEGFFYSRPNDYNDTNIEKKIKIYLNKILEMVESGFVNCLDHFDLYKKFVVLPHESIYYPYYEKIAKALKERDVAFEFNTHFYEGAGVYIPDPNLYMLTLVRDYDIPVIVSSDSHKKEDLSYNFEKAFEILKDVGIKTTCRFNDRKVIKEPFVIGEI